MARRKGHSPRCPITRKQFFAEADPIVLNIMAMPQPFSTGSFGWHFSRRQHAEIGGVKIPVQVTCSVTVVGSRSADDG